MRALTERYRTRPKKASLADDFDWGALEDSEVVRFCFKGGGQTTTQTKSDPWPQQQPYLIRGFEAAEQDVLDRPLEYFPESTVVPFSPESELALAAQTGRAIGGSPVLAGAQDYTRGVLEGEYLSPESNPYLGGISDAVLSAVQPQVQGLFGRAGRAGTSPLAAEALGRGVSRGMAPFLFGEYGRERGIMESAAARAPGLAREDYYDPMQLRNIGAAREMKSEESLADQISRFNFGQQEPTNRLAQYMNLIQGTYGGTSTATQSARSQTNPLLLGTGAALSLAGLPTAGGGSVGGSVLGK